MRFTKLNFKFFKVRKMFRWECCLSADDQRPCIVFILSFAWLTCNRPKGNLIIAYLVASHLCLVLHNTCAHRSVSLLGWICCALQFTFTTHSTATVPEASFLGHLLRFSQCPDEGTLYKTLTYFPMVSTSPGRQCTLFVFSGHHNTADRSRASCADLVLSASVVTSRTDFGFIQ